jgi:hypothetical protein
MLQIVQHKAETSILAIYQVVVFLSTSLFVVVYYLKIGPSLLWSLWTNKIS